jgi:uncharacterized protein (TIGR02145 family)
MEPRNIFYKSNTSLVRWIPLGLFIYGLFIQSCEDPAITNPADPNYDLSAPTLLSAEAITDTSIKLIWNNNEEHTREFVIKRKVGSYLYVVIGTISKDLRTFVDSTCFLGIEYNYVVQSKVESNLSASSNSKSEATTFSAPSQFSALQLSETSIQLSWQDNCDYEDGYNIERDSGSGYELLLVLGANIRTVVDTGLVYGIDYLYRVRAFTRSNVSNWVPSTEISIIFPPATNLVAIALDDSRIQLNWNDNSHNEEGFRIERDQGSGFIHVADLSEDVISYVDIELEYGPTYIYRVVGYKGEYKSNWATGNPINTIFPEPSNLLTTVINDARIELSWEDNCSFENGYKVERDSGSGYSQIAMLAGSVISYTDIDLDYGLSYTYRLKAFTNINESFYSNESLTELIISSPTNLVAQVYENDSVVLEWVDNCTFEEGYLVERKVENNSFDAIASLDANIMSYEDTDFSMDVIYTYRVFAFTDENVSHFSSEAIAWASSLPQLWEETWKVTSTTNGSSNNELSLHETINFSEVRFDGSEAFGNVMLVSLAHGSMMGSFAYNPTGQTLELLLQEGTVRWSYNNVSISDTQLSFSSSSYDYVMTEQEEITDYDFILWEETWKVTGTTNGSSNNELSLHETLSFSEVSFDGSEASGSITLMSITHGTMMGSFAYNPTGQTLELHLQEGTVRWSYNNVSISDTQLSFSSSSYDYVLTEQSSTFVVDIDGNVYQTKIIGDQEWMLENLRVTHYRDGTTIPNLTDPSEWIATSSGAYSYYDNIEDNADTYGALYNWYAVGNPSNIAPEGWHIPTAGEWQELFAFVGGSEIAGGKLKEVGTLHWISPNTDATDEYGFTALPSGERPWSNGSFQRMGEVVFFWSGTSNGAYGSGVALSYFTAGAGANDWWKENGYSVRCIKD